MVVVSSLVIVLIREMSGVETSYSSIDSRDDATRVEPEATIAIRISEDCRDFGASFHRETCSYS